MAEVIDLGRAREARIPHKSGPALCLACRHEWVAVAQVGWCASDNPWLQCPACGCLKGVFKWPCEPPSSVPVFVCNCGNRLMTVTTEGIFCPQCGNWHTDT